MKKTVQTRVEVFKGEFSEAIGGGYKEPKKLHIEDG